MNKNDTNLTKNVVWNTVGTMYYYMCQWVITVLVVRISGYSIAGYLSLAMVVTNTFYTIAQFGMRQFQISDLKSKYTDSQYVSSRYITIVFSMIICVIYSLLKTYNFLQILCILSYMILKCVEALVDVYQGIDQKNWRFDIIGKSLIARGTLVVVIFFAGLSFFKNLPLTLLLISISSLVVVYLYDIRKAKEFTIVKLKINDGNLIGLLKECIPIVVFNFLLSLVSLIARDELQALLGSDILGKYASIASPVVIIQLIASVIFNPFVPFFTQYYMEKENRQFLKLLLKFMMLIIVLLISSIIAAHFLGEWALVLVFGKSIKVYTYLLIPIIICTVITAAIWLLSALLIAIRKTKSLVFATAIGVVVSYLYAHKMILKYSINGTSYIIIIASLVQIFLMITICLIAIWRNKNE